MRTKAPATTPGLRKDRSLDELAKRGNVAQFVAFEPCGGLPVQTFSRVIGRAANHVFADPREAVAELLAKAPAGTVNLRSYQPEDPRSREFLYALGDPDEAVAALTRLVGEGLHVIVNETVDVEDGGVSGVRLGDVVEFAPDDTPRCVERPGTASLPASTAIALLERVYGFAPDIDRLSGRLEFSIHPSPQGYRRTRTLLWEHEPSDASDAAPSWAWPNRFSRHVGDKAYGLLMADIAGLAVPTTQVLARRVRPFSFGKATGSEEIWTRTAPVQQDPGRFTTVKGWTDPFALMTAEDPERRELASILVQEGVRAVHSGAALVDAEGRLVIEGVAGEGDLFMLSRRAPERLPEDVGKDVGAVCAAAARTFGPIRLEWVHDGSRAWVVQLHRGATETLDAVIVPGEPAAWTEFDADLGLDGLRALLAALPDDGGVAVRGRVGLTSHLADLLRKAGRPARMIG